MILRGCYHSLKAKNKNKRSQKSLKFYCRAIQLRQPCYLGAIFTVYQNLSQYGVKLAFGFWTIKPGIKQIGPVSKQVSLLINPLLLRNSLGDKYPSAE